MPLPKQLKALTLRKNFIWTFLGNGFFAACQWLILMLLTKLVPEKMVGQFFLGLTVTTPILLFADLNLRAVLVADAKERFSYRDFFRLRLLSIPVAFLMIFAIILVMQYRWEAIFVILLVGVYKTLEMISRLIHGLFQKYERMDKVSISLFIRGFSSVVVLALLAWLTHQVTWAIAGLILTYGASLLFYDLFQSKAFEKKDPSETGRASEGLETSESESTPAQLSTEEEVREAGHGAIPELVKHAFPLGLSALFGSLMVYIPNYVLERYRGEAELGIFSAMFYLAVLGTMVMAALGQATSARMARSHSDGNAKDFTRLLVILLVIALATGASLVFLSIFFGPQMLTFLYKASYAKYSDVFVWLMISCSCVFTTMALAYGMLASQSFKIQPLIYLISNIILLSFCLYLIPTYGMLGAAWSVAGTYTVQIAFMGAWNVHVILRLRARAG